MDLAIRGALRCVLCHAEAFGALDRCPGCGALAHRDCRLSLERCPTLGCQAPNPPLELEVRRRRPSPLPAWSPLRRLLLGAALGLFTLAVLPPLVEATFVSGSRSPEACFAADARAVLGLCRQHRIDRGRWPERLADLLQRPGDSDALPRPHEGAYRLLQDEQRVYLAWERPGGLLRAVPLYARGERTEPALELERAGDDAGPPR
ncbi:MAG: hypothetical protein AB7N76_10120 [Planctomycetota bacterium]